MLGQFIDKRIFILVLAGLLVALALCGIAMHLLSKDADIDAEQKSSTFQKLDATYVSENATLTLTRDGKYTYEYITGDAFFMGTYEYNGDICTLYAESGDVYKVFAVSSEGNLVSENQVFRCKKRKSVWPFFPRLVTIMAGESFGV